MRVCLLNCFLCSPCTIPTEHILEKKVEQFGSYRYLDWIYPIPCVDPILSRLYPVHPSRPIMSRTQKREITKGVCRYCGKQGHGGPKCPEQCLICLGVREE